MKRPALALLALSLLALLFGWETRQALRATPGGQDNAAPAPAGAWQPGVTALDPQPPPDPTPTAAAVAARPLFRPDRQPFREQGPGAARNYETELSRYTLIGVLGFGDAPVGVVVGKAGNKGERWELKAGDPLPGFTVKEVGMEGLQLTADGKEFLLPLYAGPPTAAGGALRTDVPRRDAASPKAGSPTPPAVPSPPMVPARGTVARQPVPAAPAPPPVPVPGTSPAVAPRYIPGRR
jgi:hypothetical protein